MFDCKKFLDDYQIDYQTEGKNSAPGWIQINCPFCSDTSNHGGFNITSGIYNCWICGTHRTIEIISSLLNIRSREAYDIKNKYQSYTIKLNSNSKKVVHPKVINFPDYTINLQKEHYNYLEKRRFDPCKIEKKFKLKGTQYLGDYKFRIICPIYLNGKMISYQGRDITDKSTIRYKACKKELEIVHHKHSLYNIDNANKNDVIIVEGITDVWRLENNSIALFGIKFTLPQVHMIKTKYKRVFLIFDPGEEEKKQADKLGFLLNGMGIEVENIELKDCDPGDLSYKEANYLKKQLIKE